MSAPASVSVPAEVVVPPSSPANAITNRLLDAVEAVVDGSEGLDGLGDDAHVVVRRIDFEQLVLAALAAVNGGGR